MNDMSKHYDFAVVGGDQRQVYMVNELISRGYSVVYYGRPDERMSPRAMEADSLSQALAGSYIILCPVPFTRNKTSIATLEEFTDGGVDYLLSNLKQGHTLFTGNIPAYAADYCTREGIAYNDLMRRDDVAILNAISTAEGAVAEAIIRSDINLHQSNCLVTGFGRCARVLAKKLGGLDARVTVAARSRDARVSAQAYGYDAVSFEQLEGQLNRFDYIFNTIPAVILGADQLKCLNPQVTIIDIASAPGGIDFEAAKKLHINAVLCPGLPGRYAPQTSGVILADAIENILKTKTEKAV